MRVLLVEMLQLIQVVAVVDMVIFKLLVVEMEVLE
jgi:hypothetical protein